MTKGFKLSGRMDGGAFPKVGILVKDKDHRAMIGVGKATNRSKANKSNLMLIDSLDVNSTIRGLPSNEPLFITTNTAITSPINE